MRKIISFLLIIAVISLTACSGKESEAKLSALDSKNPVSIVVWNYYNGDQLSSFEKLVEQFNTTVGMDKGIVVMTVSQGNIDTLADSLIDSINGKAGAQVMPNLAAVYAETAYILDQKGYVIPLNDYFSQDELDQYVQGFIEEGRFNRNNDLLLFPILKSTEIFTANITDWIPFEADTGVTLESIKTKEDLTTAAEIYYNWTDAQTEDVMEDGKALYGRDAISNYIYLGCHQLGHDMFTVKNGEVTVDLDRNTFKTLWDNYYVPYINGYFGSYAKFRSEDAKTGKILCLTSSSAAVSYLPAFVTLEDDSKHAIENYAREDMMFQNTVVDDIVQQGASYCVLKGTQAEQEASVEFLKWFSDSEQNLQFAVMSGYSPVTVQANDLEAIKHAFSYTSKNDKIVLESLNISAKGFLEKETYAQKPFKGSKEVRTYIGDVFQDVCEADRASVVLAMQAGSTREEATAQYITEEYFEQWFSKVSEHISSLVQ